MTIFSIVFSVCFLLFIPQDCTIQIQLGQEAKHLVDLFFCLLISLNHNPCQSASCELHLLSLIFVDCCKFGFCQSSLRNELKKFGQGQSANYLIHFSFFLLTVPIHYPFSFSFLYLQGVILVNCWSSVSHHFEIYKIYLLTLGI